MSNVNFEWFNNYSLNINLSNNNFINESIIKLKNKTNYKNMEDKILQIEKDYFDKIDYIKNLYNNSNKIKILKTKNSLIILQKELEIIKILTKYTLQNKILDYNFFKLCLILLLDLSETLRLRLNQKNLLHEDIKNKKNIIDDTKKNKLNKINNIIIDNIDSISTNNIDSIVSTNNIDLVSTNNIDLVSTNNIDSIVSTDNIDSIVSTNNIDLVSTDNIDSIVSTDNKIISDTIIIDKMNAYSISRCSYKFCSYKDKCSYNYNTKSKNLCYQDHYVHNMVSADLKILLKYINENFNNSINILHTKEILKTINTLSFVISHMENELRIKCLCLPENEWESCHFIKYK